MIFKYLDQEAGDIKSLIRQVGQAHKITLDLELVTVQKDHNDSLCKWNDPESCFVKELDVDIKQYEKQIDLFIKDCALSINSDELDVYKLLEQFQKDKYGKDKLEALIELTTGQKLEANIEAVNRADILHKIHENTKQSIELRKVKRILK